MRSKSKRPAAADPVHPSHYRGTRVQQIIREFGLGWNLANVVKYALRCNAKGEEIIDLEKARQYLDWELEERKKG